MQPRASVWLAALVVCSACGAPPTTQAPTERPTLRIGVGLPSAGPTVGIPVILTNLTGDHLFTAGMNGRPTSEVFDHWRRSPDGLRWNLSLRSGIRFHDGGFATADAVKQILEPELRNPFRAPGFIDIASISAPDSTTVAIELKRPSAFLLDDLTGYSLERTVVKENDTEDGETKEKQAEKVGIGPFVTDSVSQDRATLHAFDDYFQGRPSIGRLELISYPTIRTAWTAMMRGEIDSLYEVGREAEDFVEAESTVRVYSFARPYVHVLGFNVRLPVFRNPAVRRAISEAIDRKAILHTVLHDRGRVADGYLWPSHWAYDSSAPAFRFDPESAGRTLDRAGLRVKATRGSMPQRFSFSCMVVEGAPPFEQMSLVVQRQLYNVGVNMTIEPLPLGEIARRLANGTFDAFLFEMASPRILSWAYRFFHSPTDGFQPYLGWGYTAADTALDEIRYAVTDDQVRAGVARFQRALYDDPPAAFITWDERARAVSRRFIVPDEPGMDVFPSIWRWKAARPSRN